MVKNIEDLSGKSFNDWSVIRRDCDYKRNVYWICKCKCGLEKSVSGSHLRLGKSKSCRKCSEHKSKNKLSSRVWHRIKSSPYVRKIDVDLGNDIEAKKFLWDLLIKQKNKCAISGLPISLSNTEKEDMRGFTTASVDRINSNKGYTRDNVQWVHKLINRMKSDLDQDKFLSLCESVYQWNKKTSF